jgi:hypothetical protein
LPLSAAGSAEAGQAFCCTRRERVGTALKGAVKRLAECLGRSGVITTGGEVLAKGCVRFGQLEPRGTRAQQRDSLTRMLQRVRSADLRKEAVDSPDGPGSSDSLGECQLLERDRVGLLDSAECG